MYLRTKILFADGLEMFTAELKISYSTEMCPVDACNTLYYIYIYKCSVYIYKYYLYIYTEQ